MKVQVGMKTDIWHFLVGIENHFLLRSVYPRALCSGGLG